MCINGSVYSVLPIKSLLTSFFGSLVLCFMQIINDEDPNWYKAEYNGRFGYVPATYLQYVKPP